MLGSLAVPSLAMPASVRGALGGADNQSAVASAMVHFGVTEADLKKVMAAALEKGQHTLPQYTDGDLASCEQLVAGLREEQAVGDGAFHRLPSVVSNESRAAAAAGRHSS